MEASTMCTLLLFCSCPPILWRTFGHRTERTIFLWYSRFRRWLAVVAMCQPEGTNPRVLIALFSRVYGFMTAACVLCAFALFLQGCSSNIFELHSNFGNLASNVGRIGPVYSVFYSSPSYGCVPPKLQKCAAHPLRDKWARPPLCRASDGAIIFNVVDVAIKWYF